MKIIFTAEKLNEQFGSNHRRFSHFISTQSMKISAEFSSHSIDFFMITRKRFSISLKNITKHAYLQFSDIKRHLPQLPREMI